MVCWSNVCLFSVFVILHLWLRVQIPLWISIYWYPIVSFDSFIYSQHYSPFCFVDSAIPAPLNPTTDCKNTNLCPPINLDNSKNGSIGDDQQQKKNSHCLHPLLIPFHRIAEPSWSWRPSSHFSSCSPSFPPVYPSPKAVLRFILLFTPRERHHHQFLPPEWSRGRQYKDKDHLPVLRSRAVEQRNHQHQKRVLWDHLRQGERQKLCGADQQHHRHRHPHLLSRLQHSLHRVFRLCRKEWCGWIQRHSRREHLHFPDCWYVCLCFLSMPVRSQKLWSNAHRHRRWHAHNAYLDHHHLVCCASLLSYPNSYILKYIIKKKSEKGTLPKVNQK